MVPAQKQSLHASREAHQWFTTVLREAREAVPEEARASVSDSVLGGVLRELAINAPDGCSRADLAARVGELADRVGPDNKSAYSGTTISKALAILEKAGFVTRRTSVAGPAGGRPPVRYSLGSQWSMLGVHVSVEGDRPRKLTANLHDLSCQLLESKTRELPEDTWWSSGTVDWTSVAREIGVFVRDVMRAWGVGKDQGAARPILGVGVEVPGHVHAGRVLQGAHAGYGLTAADAAHSTMPEFAVEISSYLDGLAVVLENDANLIALREVYRSAAASRAREGAVVAVFDQGVGSGLLANGVLYRGHRGAAGEIGHNPVFVEPGKPRTSRPPSREAPMPSQPGFNSSCSCDKFGHVDCYATPERLTGELMRPTSDFETIASTPAYTQDGELTAEGKAFWTGGTALGTAIVSLLHVHNPGWIQILLPPALTTPTDGTAAMLYREAIEVVVDENAFSTSAYDARESHPSFDVQPLALGEAAARKAARNAALRVLDEFTAHAMKRDDCIDTYHGPTDQKVLETPQKMTLRERMRAIQREVRAILKHYDPEDLIAAGAPSDEYSTEESEFLRLVRNGDVTQDNVRNVWAQSFGKNANLLRDQVTLNALTRDVLALQLRWHSSLSPSTRHPHGGDVRDNRRAVS